MKEFYFLIIGFILGLAFYPLIKNYLLNKITDKFTDNKKVQQDILKEIYKSNKENNILTIDILHKKINIPISNLLKILSKLISLNYVYLSDNDIRLTNKGKEEAKDIINKHRLLESYLFEKTSTKLKDIHKIADKKEHLFNEEQIGIIKNELSNPCIDPHGDILDENILDENITSFSKVITLGYCQENEIYIVKHIEDEPAEIYEHLVNLDLAPFDKIKIIKINKDYISIINDKGKKIDIEYFYANNIFVNKIEKNEKIQNYFDFLLNHEIITLNKLKLRNPGLIVGLSFYIRGIQRQRLMELGFIKGNVVIPMYNNSITDDPRAYKIKNSIISLRTEQASKIYVLDLLSLNNINQEKIKELINV